ncbi:prepilin peptidase [Campylobacter portucalensis]|nr:A24 family peptidase [Campylobacter portucalensis]
MILGIFYFIFGVCIGSFSNVLIYRLPENKSINFPASHCLKCKTPLKWYHNIPLFSWIFLGGKCAFCKTKISFQYPLIELICGFLMLICMFKEVSNFEIVDYFEIYKTFMIGVLFIVLLAMAVIDFRYTAAPSVLLYVAVILSLLYKFNFEGVKFALIFGGGIFILTFLLTKILKKEAMGEADIYIFACIGAVLGLNLGLLAVFVSAILSLFAFMVVSFLFLLKSKKNNIKSNTQNQNISQYQMPFIPFLSAGLFVVYVFEDKCQLFLKMIIEGNLF